MGEHAGTMLQKLMGMASAPGNIVAALGAWPWFRARIPAKTPRMHARTPHALVPTGDVTSLLYALAHRPPTSHGFGGQQRFFLQSSRERRRLSRLRVRQPHGASGACSVACDAATPPALPCVTS